MVLLKLMTTILLKILKHPLKVKWQRQDLNADLLGSLEDDQRYPRALTKPVSWILCKHHLSRVLLQSRTHSKYLLWGNCEILMKRTLREKTFPLTHTSLPSSDPRRCRKRSLGGFALKCTLAQSVERTIALKAKPVAIKILHFCLIGKNPIFL